MTRYHNHHHEQLHVGWTHRQNDDNNSMATAATGWDGDINADRDDPTSHHATTTTAGDDKEDDGHPHHHITPNHHLKQLLVGRQPGATRTGMGKDADATTTTERWA